MPSAATSSPPPSSASQDDYVGESRIASRYFLGGTYKFSRGVWLKGELRQDWLNSSAPNASYRNATLLFGVRLQR